MSTKQTPNEVEEVKDLEQVEEVQDLTEIEKVEDLTDAYEEIKEAAPVLKSGGLRGAADPNMIQKHIDNFLAMLCGETPVDSNVRTSAEYWLKRLATGEGAGSTKKIYRHTITCFKSSGDVQYACSFDFFNDTSTAIESADNIIAALSDQTRFMVSGYIYDYGNANIYGLSYSFKDSGNYKIYCYNVSTGARDYSTFSINSLLSLATAINDTVVPLN